MKKLLYAIAGSLLVFASSEIQAQCAVSILNNGSQDTLEVPCGSQAQLQRDTLGGFALFTDFDLGFAGNGWQTTSQADFSNPCGPKNSTYLWMGNTATAPRNLATTPLNLSCGAEVCFELRYSIQGGAQPCEGPDLTNEGVTFEYSLNNGASWVQIDYYPPNTSGSLNSQSPGSGDYTGWATYCYVLPAAASVNNVTLRWQQYASTAAGNDHWGMDSITVRNFCASVTNIWNTGDTSEFITTNDILVPTPYNVTRIVTDPQGGSDTCYDSIIVQPRLPLIPVNAKFEPFCKNSDAEVIVDFNNASFMDTTVTYNYSWMPDIFDSSTIDYGIVRGLTADTSTVFHIEHPTYAQCSFSDTVDLLAGGVEIDSTFLDESSCYREPTSDMYVYWINEISTPLIKFFKDGAQELRPLDTVFSDLESGTYQIILSDDRCADTLDFTVSVPDTVGTDISNVDTNICAESTTDIWFTASGGTAPYSLYMDSLLVDTFSLQSSVDTSFYLYAVDSNGCASDSIRKTFIIPPPITIEPYDTLVCPNIPFAVTAVASGGLGGPYNYAWSTGDSTATSILVGEEGTAYAVTAYDGCSESAVMVPEINLIPTPEHTIVREYLGRDPLTGEELPIIIADNQIVLEEVAPLAINFRPEPKLPGSTYQWDLWANGSIADQSFGWPVIPPDSAVDVGFRYAKDGIYEVLLVTTTEEGCIDTARAVHNLSFVGTEINIFSPNGDGINDIFYIPGTEALRDYRMEIYNRWGTRVFESTNPNTPENGGGWDGGDQPDGTYFYIVTGKTGDGSEEVKKGTVTISGSNK